MIKRFKRFIREADEEDKQSLEGSEPKSVFDSFVEEYFKSKVIDDKKYLELINEKDLLYTGPGLKPLIMNTAAFLQYDKDVLDVDGLEKLIIQNVKSEKAFPFCKPGNGAKKFGPVENYVKTVRTDITEQHTVLIYQVPLHSALDLTKYSGKDQSALNRIKNNQEVIGAQTPGQQKLAGVLFFSHGGWKTITDFDVDFASMSSAPKQEEPTISATKGAETVTKDQKEEV